MSARGNARIFCRIGTYEAPRTRRIHEGERSVSRTAIPQQSILPRPHRVGYGHRSGYVAPKVRLMPHVRP